MRPGRGPRRFMLGGHFISWAEFADILDEMKTYFDAPQHWFTEKVMDGEWFGEDLMFCLRAASLGHPVLAHSGVRLTHYKEIGLTFPAPDEPEENS